MDTNLTTILTQQELAWEKYHLQQEIEQIETKILVYSDRDRIVTSELEKKLQDLNLQYLELMLK